MNWGDFLAITGIVLIISSALLLSSEKLQMIGVLSGVFLCLLGSYWKGKLKPKGESKK